MMRKGAFLVTAALLAACTHDGPEPAVASHAPEPTPPPNPVPEAPPQYVVGDPARASALTVLPLGDGQAGVILEGQRFAFRSGAFRAARDVSDPPLGAGFRVPPRLGGGYLFRARNALYASDSFEGLLRPVVALPADVSQVSFASSAALVRTDSGERWMIDLATGRRLPIAPPGLLDVAALDDGRAAALVEGGGLLVSTDSGAHWSDASSRLRSPARRVFVDVPAGGDAGLWVETQAGQAARIMPGGRVAEYDTPPPTAAAAFLRPKPEGWREDEPPIRRAIRAGAPLSDGSALVVASGDLVRVDLMTGAIEVVAAGRLPPDATCAGTRTPSDIVFTCGRPNGSAFVVSHALERAPIVEQTFQEGGRFVVSDDGGIAFLGSCDRPSPHDRHMACVRAPGGSWQQYDPDAGMEAGASPVAQVVRWVPRGDGDAIAIVSGIAGVSNAWGLVDARTGQLHVFPIDAVTSTLQSALVAAPESSRGGSYDVARLADRGWTVTPQGTLRGWASLAGGIGAIEVGLDGSLQTSPFTFERVAGAGVLALARLKDGRVWQTVDRGANWSEVAAPSAMKPNGWLDPHACSLVGCDLAQWYRIGWAATPPLTLMAPTVAPPAPRLERAPIPALACHAAGDPKRSAAPRGERSPEDLGLGAVRVAVSDPSGRLDFLRLSFGRRIVGPREQDSSDEAALRALVHGPSTQPGDDRLVVMGPSRDAMSLSRQVSFVAAFDPLGIVRRASVTMPAIVAAARAAGSAVADVLRDDPVPSGVLPVTPVDPGAANDLLVQLANGGVALLPATAKGGGHVRVAYEPGRGDDWHVVSALGLEGDAAAWLEEDASGQGRVMRLGSSGAPSPVMSFDAPPSSELVPANVDALAVGPRGELAVLRAPSGGEPPSVLDPALVIVPGAASLALAPWSTLLPADDPACRADAAGWRATIPAIAPWLRLSGGAELHGVDDAPMLARVRWSPVRVCLEGVEVRASDTTVAGPVGSSPFGSPWDQPLETWVVARFTAATAMPATGGGAASASNAGKVAVVSGAELHQALECSLAPP